MLGVSSVGHCCLSPVPKALAPRRFRLRGFSSSSIAIVYRSPRSMAASEECTVQSPNNGRKLSIKNANGEKLVGILTDAGSTEICILCHGFRSNKDFYGLRNLTSVLAGAGISSFRFDFSGNGESEGEFSFGGYMQEVEDLRAVIQHWRSEDREVNVILGHSKGGDDVLLYASKYGDVSTVINASGRCDLRKGLDSRLGKDYMERIDRDGFIIVKDKNGDFKVTKESLMLRLNIDMKEEVKKIACRVFTIHGSADEVIPVEDSYEFDKLIPKHVLRIIEGANHSYEHHQSELASAVLEIVQGQKHASS